jgi:EmrB/QacA subfamily drug resistance transporter
VVDSEVMPLHSRDGSQRDSRWLSLVVLCAGFLMIVLDQTVVNVALPSIQDDLGFSQASLAWVVNAYLIAFGGLLLLAGRLGDLFGRKRIFMLGLAVFTAASALCGLAQSQELLVAARFVQGVGGALTAAVILGIIVTMFPEPGERAKALGVYTFVAAGGGSIGLLAGGILTETINWHWIFYVNLPIGIATAILIARLLDDDRGIGLGRGADLLGAVLVVGALMIGIYAILEAGDRGWASVRTVALGAAATALLIGFVVRQARAQNPLVPLRVFRSRIVSAANGIQALAVAGLFGMFFLGALYLQRVLGYSAIEVGLAFLPVALLIGAMSVGVSARLIMRFGATATLLPGLGLIAIGLALFARAPVDGHYVPDVLPVMLLIGIGGGVVFPSLFTLALSSAGPSDSGLASGLVNTSQQVGGALGLAVLASLSTTHSDTLLKSGEPQRSALTSGYQLALALGAGLVILAFALAAIVLRRGPAAAVVEAETGEGAPAAAEEEAA